MKIDLSQEQGALVPLYFFRQPLGWPDRRQTDALNSLMKSRAQDTNHADDCRKYAAEGENEKYEMKN